MDIVCRLFSDFDDSCISNLLQYEIDTKQQCAVKSEVLQDSRAKGVNAKDYMVKSEH